MPAENIYTLTVKPGIQRDVTTFSSPYWTDGSWCRFYSGLPRKIGGYSSIFNSNTVPRGTYVVPDSPNFNVYIGDSDSLNYVTIDQDRHVLNAPVDRTPVLFNSNANNLWSFDTMFSTVDDGSILIAHAAPNLFSIDSNVEAPIYFGDSFSNSALVSTGHSVSGGIVVLHPYLFMFGNNGEISWSNANDPTTIMDSARITGRKIIAGCPTRGGNSSPAGLFWSLDSVIRCTQVGTDDVEFAFDTVSSASSILSSKCVIEYDGVYYWAGVDRFLMYNGVVQELSNEISLNFFFNNLNYDQRQKVWATKETRFGEIWWHFPMGNSTECNHAIVYNIRENCWYDTPVSRSSGYFEQTFSYPIWTDNVLNNNNEYPVWVHEVGTDKNENGTLTAIDSYIKTCPISWCGTGPTGQPAQTDAWIYLYRLEPDFAQSGNMTLQVSGRKYANSPEEFKSPETFSNQTTKLDIKVQYRQMMLKFRSNEVGGSFQMGRVLVVMREGDHRQ